MKFSESLFDLCNNRDVLRDQIETLLPQERPLVIIGAGRAAEGVSSVLKGWGIHVDDICVNDAYWKEGQIHDGFPVRKFSDVCKKYSSFDVVIAVVSNWQRLRDEVMATGKVWKCIFWGHTRAEARFSWAMIEQHKHALDELYDNLADDYSRRVMLAAFSARLLNNKELLDSVDVNGEDQYFSPLIDILADEVFVDCGAYNGDTFDIFQKHAANGFSKYVAFECDPQNYIALKGSSEDRRLICIQKGVSNAPGCFKMNASGCSSSALSEGGGVDVQLTTIDLEEECQDATFIKMDIEGAELAALHGGELTIRKNQPKLAICIYHKAEDFWTIPQYILSLNPSYKLFLRHYPSTVTDEIVLYAVP